MPSPHLASGFGSVPRRAGAPRLIEWTGERCVPWAPDAQVVYEHFHRYLWAAALVSERRVLDLASGEGFGAAILATAAGTVVGVDVDEPSVAHSRLNYGAANLSFAVADARELNAFADDAFDVVVAFEMIEHLEEQERVLAEIKRVLIPGGLVILSTPDRDAYRHASSENPFHVRELGRAELREVLGANFTHTAIFAQRTIAGSAIAAVQPAPDDRPDAAAANLFIEPAGEDWRVLTELSPLYLVAVASDAALPELPARSTLADPRLALLRQAEARAEEAKAETRQGREALAQTQQALTAAHETLVRTRQELEDQLQDARGEIARGEHELQETAQALGSLSARNVQDASTIAGLDAALNEAHRRLKRVDESVTWQLFQRVRSRSFALLGGEGSSGVRALQSSLRMLGRRSPRPREVTAAAAAPSAGPPPRPRPESISFPEADSPDVSIVIPLFAHAQLTRAALWSILDHTPQHRYEVILVDDSEDPPTKRLLEQVSGAQVEVNASNLGYLRSVNRGAARARGRWLILCNNDIEVQPGWLSGLLDCGDSRPDVAVVTPKYLNPDRSLSEAGGIVWRDGSGCNYGRGDDAGACHYEYVRDVDYGSAAALMVRADFWREVGGYDERFLPMYYEDTDLCFEARSRGLRVLYAPRSHVIHAEGSTAGSDTSTGHKRHQEHNRRKFADKWQERLDQEHIEFAEGVVWLAANLRRDPRVLVVDHRVPTWDRDSGGLRMRAILLALLELGCHVTLLPDNLYPAQPYTRELQRSGVEVLFGVDPDETLARIGPGLSLVILSRPQVASRWLPAVREHAPAATAVFDTVDLHWLREARRDSLSGGRSEHEVSLSDRVRAMRELELALIRGADATLVVTDEERVQVESDVPEATVRVVPNANEVVSAVTPAGHRDGVLFVGGFEHPPNVDAARMLVNEVMPLVWRRRADTAVTIVGADPPAEVQALRSDLVAVTGWVPDLSPLLSSARMLLAPLTYGAGLKGKVTQALACGVPVVTTPVGAEGLDAVNGEHMLIAETPEGLARAAVELLEDDVQWERLSQRGRQLAAEKCSPEVMRGRLHALLDELVGDQTAVLQTR